MTIAEANYTLFKARSNFQNHLDLKGYKVEELAKYLGKTNSYVYQLLNGQANNRVAYANVNKLMAYTDYKG